MVKLLFIYYTICLNYYCNNILPTLKFNYYLKIYRIDHNKTSCSKIRIDFIYK